MRRPGDVLTRLPLLEHAWDYEYENRSNVVDVYVRYLREKIDRPFGRESIETVRGAGYRLRGRDDPAPDPGPADLRLRVAMAIVSPPRASSSTSGWPRISIARSTGTFARGPRIVSALVLRNGSLQTTGSEHDVRRGR